MSSFPHHLHLTAFAKAKAEVGVQIVGRWILARLRNQRFFSLIALNDAIRALLAELNNRPLRSWGRSRRDLFDELDRPVLIALPDEPYEYAEWKRCRVNLDYHVEIDKHYYSVPYSLARQEVEARITVKTVEIFLRGKRVASQLTGGFWAASYNAGSFSIGTFAPDPANGNIQHAINDGPHTLSPPANPCTILIEYTNGESAGSIDTDGFDIVMGAFDTGYGGKYLAAITKTNSASFLQIQALSVGGGD